MWRYIVKRLLWLIVIMVCVAVLIFTVMWFVPGDPASIILAGSGNEIEVQELRVKLGLDKPYIVQLGNYLVDTFLKFDLGTSYVYKVPVITELKIRLPRTFLLGLMTIIISSAVGIPLGVTAALHRNQIQDQGLLVFAMFFVSMPQFWLAMEMIVIFSVKLGILPPSGVSSWKCWIMPVLTGAIGSMAGTARQARSSVLESARADFVTTARAKGVPERTVVWKHMIPNGLIPVINGLGNSFAMAIGGTVLIEVVFGFPGIGTYMTTAIGGRDYPVIRSCVLLLAIYAAIVMLLVDLVYAYLDPRIKAQYSNYASKKKRR